MIRIHSILKQTALAAALATVALATPTAFAQGQARGHDRHHDHRNDHRDHRDDHRGDYRDHRNDRAYRDYQKAQRKAYQQQRKDYRRWARGQYIPRDYMATRYYINDYRDYRLAPPPRGYVWVQPYQHDDTYYMVQLATGLIAQAFAR